MAWARVLFELIVGVPPLDISQADPNRSLRDYLKTFPRNDLAQMVKPCHAQELKLPSVN